MTINRSINGRQAIGLSILGWLVSFAVLAALFHLVGCAGPGSGPVVEPAAPVSPTPIISDVGTAAGTLADKADATAKVIVATTQPSAMVRAQWAGFLNGAAVTMRGWMASLADAATKIDAKAKWGQAGWDEAKAQEQAKLTAQANEKKAAQSKMLADAAWWGIGIGIGAGLIALGIWLSRMGITLAGAAVAAGSFVMVLVYLALAWVAAHLWLVILCSVGVVGGAVGLWFLGEKYGWWTDKQFTGAAKLLIEGKTSEAIAVLRAADPAFNKAFNAANIATPVVMPAQPVLVAPTLPPTVQVSASTAPVAPVP